MTKNNYWEKRALENENRVRTIAKVGKKEIEANFSETLTKIQKEILYWYNRFAKNNGITKAEAYRLMNSRELDELNWDVKEYVKKGIENAITQMPDVAKQLENASAKFHITRLDALKTQVLSMCDQMFADTEKSVKECLSEVYKDTYYHTAYDYQDGIGIYADFAKIDDNFLGRILEKPWADDGSNFSERIWGKYRPQLVNRLHKDLTDCVIRGRNPNEYTESIAKDFKVSMNQASNLVMTEYSYFNSKATYDCHEKLDVEEFEVCETLDSGTCKTCQNIDGKHFPMSEFSIGVNAPPFHCGCRGTTIPYFDDEFTQNEKRAYRGEDGKTHYTSAKNYKEWKEEFVKESYEKAPKTVDIEEKIKYNKDSNRNKADKEQYEAYKEILGKNAPKSFEEFQNLKYGDAETWDLFKSYKRAIASGELTPLADFELYQKTDKEIKDKIIGITTSNGIKINGRSKHLISRVIGSIADKREGIPVDDILEALKKPSSVKPVRKDNNGYSQKFVLNGICMVSINPYENTIIQVNPFKRKKGDG